jgi:hypothetical protein
MGKQPAKATTNTPGQFFVFGIDADGKPRGARFGVASVAIGIAMLRTGSPYSCSGLG